MKKDVFSAQTGRKLAKIELIDAAAPLNTGNRYSFRVVHGFGNMWRKSFNGENMTIVTDEEQEVLLNVVAFPAEKEGVGIMDIDMALPARSQADLEAVDHETPRSFATRVRGYFLRARS
jgi:hypothetical protein